MRTYTSYYKTVRFEFHREQVPFFKTFVLNLAVTSRTSKTYAIVLILIKFHLNYHIFADLEHILL